MKLSYASRKRMSNSTFAIPGARKYPIPDLAHARNALARVAQHGSPSEKARVHHAVAMRFHALAQRSEAIQGKSKANSPHDPS